MSSSVLKRGTRLANEDKVGWFHYGINEVFGMVEGTGTYHYPHIRFGGERFCDCKGHVMGGNVCSHMVALAEHIEPPTSREQVYNALETPEEEMTQLDIQDLYVETDLDQFNLMMGKNGKGTGLPQKSGTVIGGEFEAGKSILTFQFSFDVMKKMSTKEGEDRYSWDEGTNYNSIIVDTEGDLQTYAWWKETFETRFNIDTEIIKVNVHVDDKPDDDNILRVGFDYDRNPDVHQIFVMNVRTLEDILAMHGRPGEVVADKKKMHIRPYGEHMDVWDSAIGQFIWNNDVRYIAYDSITNPLEHFTNDQQDFPGRAKATQWWLGQTQALAQEMDMVQIYVAHLSKNPTNMYDTPTYVGGKAVKHNNKHAIYLRDASSSKNEGNPREMRLWRHPGKESWVKDDRYHIDLQDGKGFVDGHQ